VGMSQHKKTHTIHETDDDERCVQYQ